MIQNWSVVLQSSFQDIWKGFAEFVPNLVVALIIFLIGWFVANLLGKVVAQIIRSIKVDHALRTAQVDQFLKRAGFNLDSGAFIGGLVEWFIIIVFLVASFDVLGLNQVNAFLQQVVLYLPQVIVASFIILVAAVIAEAMQKVVSGAAAAGGIRSANFAGSIARWSIWIFGILTALYQLGVAGPFIQTLFTGIVVAVAIALGLAFGLGGQETAAEILAKVRQEISDRNR